MLVNFSSVSLVEFCCALARMMIIRPEEGCLLEGSFPDLQPDSFMVRSVFMITRYMIPDRNSCSVSSATKVSLSQNSDL